jgi:hypothetical protein
MLACYVCVFSIHLESPDIILGGKPCFLGGRGVCHIASTKGARVRGKDQLMQIGFQQNSYNINAQVNYKLATIIK